MNEFARSLRKLPLFTTARTGADIRTYAAGWRLEKWVEADLSRSSELTAAWWIEFGPFVEGWLIESSVSIDPGEFWLKLQTRRATSAATFAQELTAALSDLKGAMHDLPEFARAIAGS